MQALQVQREIQWTMCDVQSHVACCVSVEVQRCVEVQNRYGNALCGVFHGHVCLQIPMMCVIHQEESMVERPVEKCGIQRKPVLDLVGHVAGAVEVERGEIFRHIKSDIDSVGEGNVDEVNRGSVLLTCTNASIPAIHLFRTVKGDVEEVLALKGCSGRTDSNDRLVRVLVRLGEVGFELKVGQQRIGFVQVDGEVGRAGKWEEWRGFVVPGHWYGNVGTKVKADELGTVKDIHATDSSLK